MGRFIKIFVGAMFVIVPILIVAGFLWNIYLYRDCRADGHKAYQCQAILSNPSYVAVDDITNE